MRFPTRLALGWCLLTATAACRLFDPSAPAPGATPATPSVASATSPPEWRPGDRWTYDVTTGGTLETKTTEVVEIKKLNGVTYYVLRVGDVDHYHTLDLSWAAGVRDSKVEGRMVPPHPWVSWPLSVGRRWTHEGTWEDREAKRRYTDSFAVVAAETVEVPAGRFEALKIVRAAGTEASDQYWYVPAVRTYVRWVGRSEGIAFEERLREYRPASLAPRSSSGSPSERHVTRP